MPKLTGGWHYRAAYIDYAMPGGDIERQWGVVEFYPTEDGLGGWTGDFVKPIGDDEASLVEALHHMIDDITKRGEEPIHLEEEPKDG